MTKLIARIHKVRGWAWLAAGLTTFNAISAASYAKSLPLGLFSFALVGCTFWIGYATAQQQAHDRASHFRAEVRQLQEELQKVHLN